MRARAVRAFFVSVLLVQGALVAHAYDDPHARFGFQPFNHSDTWQAEIVRVTATGERLAVEGGRWEGYEWNSLVGVDRLRNPWLLRHATAGIESTLAFFDEALDWVADHTPRDRRTSYLEAVVTWYEDGDGPHRTVVRSEVRQVVP